MNPFSKFKMPRLKLPSLYADKKTPRKPPNYLVWAFLIPFLGLLAVMAIGRYEPFGSDRSMLYSDMYHQYYPFFVNFRKRLLAGESLLYNWDIGMGVDYLGLISYYLASPLNLLSVFVPADYTLEYFSLLAPIKLGLASLFFAFFLKKIFDHNDFSISIFGSFYGLCAWGLGYHWNVMWLDSFALLPLVALGTVYLLRDKKFILYTITLTLSVLINYYIGLFVCIFVFFIFVCYQICRFQGFKRFAQDLGRIALFSVLAIGMTLFLELPALAALQNTYSSVNQFPDTFRLNIVNLELYTPATEAWETYKAAKASGDGFFQLLGPFFNALGKSIGPILEGMRQAVGNTSGGNPLTLKEGLPNLYCGIGTLLLSFLFLTAKEVKLRDKICSVFLLVFFLLSILIVQLDYIWHGFHFTNMIPYRFSFLYSFVMLYMAYRAWLLRDNFKLWQFIVAGVLSLGILLCSDRRFYFVYMAYNISILLLVLGVFIYMVIDRKLDKRAKEPLSVLALERRERFRSRYGTAAVLIVMSLELVLNVANFGVRFTYTPITAYPRRHENTSAAIEYMNGREDGNDFFRAEVSHEQTLNDSALNGYSGISTFTSSANVRVTRYLEALGFSAKDTHNRYLYEDSSPLANMFLNVKYLIDRHDSIVSNPYYDRIHTFKNVELLENNAYLPLGFLANSELTEWDWESEKNPIIRQNELFKLATGIDENLWSFSGANQLTLTASDIELPYYTENGYCVYKAETGGVLRYKFQMHKDGFMCFRASSTERNSFTVYKNGREQYTDSITLPEIFAVSDVQVGDTIIIDVGCKQGTNGTISIRSAIMDDELFRKGYEVLAASTLDLTEFSGTRVEGTINCNRDGLLYTSIPYDGNWVATVDGEPVDVELVGNCMMALKLTKGTHTVKFVYRNQAFIYGSMISLLCAAAFVGLILWSRRRKPEPVHQEPIPEPEPPIQNES